MRIALIALVHMNKHLLVADVMLGCLGTALPLGVFVFNGFLILLVG
jgi:hypothetical protein